jgi:hypothetical protein
MVREGVGTEGRHRRENSEVCWTSGKTCCSGRIALEQGRIITCRCSSACVQFSLLSVDGVIVLLASPVSCPLCTRAPHGGDGGCQSSSWGTRLGVLAGGIGFVAEQAGHLLREHEGARCLF